MSSIRTPLTVSPHEYFGDITGRPLDYGTIYFGEPDKDPEFYPIDVYSDEALTQPIPQPIRTKGGFINVNGDIIEIFGRPAIYSVKVLDQYGRKIFYKGKAMRNNVNDDIIAEIDAAIQQSKNDGVEYAKKAVKDAINSTAIDNNTHVDTLVTATPKAEGAVARTQADKNSDIMHINDFGGDFTAAGNWLKQSPNSTVNLSSGVTYIVKHSVGGTENPIYFNRFVCDSGTAIVVVDKNTWLTAKTTGSQENNIVLKGLDVRWVGKRTTVLNDGSHTAGKLYIDYECDVGNVDIRDITFRSLLSIDDLSSFDDSVGRSRSGVGFAFNAYGSVAVDNVSTFGVRTLMSIKPKNPGLTYNITNIKARNTETVIYLPQGSYPWQRGTVAYAAGINTKSQQAYWHGSEDPTKPNGHNGKNVVMCEAQHDSEINIHDIYAENMIECAVYCQSGKNTISKITDIGSRASANVKKVSNNHQNYTGSHSNISDLKFIGLDDSTGVMPAIGYEKYTIDNLSGDLHPNNRRAIVYAGDVGYLQLKNCNVSNASAIVLMNSGARIDRLSISDVVLSTSGIDNIPILYNSSGWVENTPQVKELSITNVEFRNNLSIYSAFYSSALHNPKIGKINLNNVKNAPINFVPFRITQDSNWQYNVTLNAVNCTFDMYYTAVGQVCVDRVVGERSSFKASVFDFKVNIYPVVPASNTNPEHFATITYKKDVDTGLVLCNDYWRTFEFSYAFATKNKGALKNYAIATLGDYSFECTATFGKNVIKFIYDADKNTVIDLYSIGVDIVDKSVWSSSGTGDNEQKGIDKFHVFMENKQLKLLVGFDRWTKPYRYDVDIVCRRL